MKKNDNIQTIINVKAIFTIAGESGDVIKPDGVTAPYQYPFSDFFYLIFPRVGAHHLMLPHLCDRQLNFAIYALHSGTLGGRTW